MNDNKHPDPKQLAAYRAGDYHAQPTQERKLATHLAQCSRCSQDLQFWSGLEQPLEHFEQVSQPWLATQLAQRRADISKKTVRRGIRWFPLAVPVLASAFAAVVVWRSELLVQPAAIVAPAGLSAAVELVAARDEMYANIDFYLWLDAQTEGSDAAKTVSNSPG